MEAASVRIRGLQIGIIVLTVATALIHLTRNFPDPMFILNGLGYLGLLGAMYLPIPFFQQRHRLVRFALMGFTALTVLLWAIMGARTPVGYIDKVIEVLLLGLLFAELQAERPVTARKVT